MPQTSAAPQRLKLRPETFGQAFPRLRESRPGWLPEDVFASITNTDEEYSILCPQEVVPSGVPRIEGLRVLSIQPGGQMIFEVMRSIDEVLTKKEIPVVATSNPKTDLGFMVVSDGDLPAVRALLAEAGHTLEEPDGAPARPGA